MFRNCFREFENDPFFEFGSSSFDFPSDELFNRFHLDTNNGRGDRLAITDKHHGDKERYRRRDRDENQAVVPRGRYHDDMALDLPRFGFGSFDKMFTDMNRMMSDMHNHMERLQERSSRPDFDGHMYSSSSVYSYANTGKDSEPKVYQAHSETRAGPGGIRETKKAMRDSHLKREKMAVGHHIGDRGHVVERKRDLRTGDKEEDHHYHGIDEADGNRFDTEWEERADSLNSRFRRDYRSVTDKDDYRRRPKHKAITDGRHHKL